jgi:hypothetical protein
MKRVIALMIGVASTASAFSQLSLGLHATGNLSDASIKTFDFVNPTKKSRVLPGGGIVADYRISPSLTLRSGVNFLQQGIKLNATITDIGEQVTNIETQAKANLSYLQVPVNLLYTTKGALSFYAGGGPYVSFGLSGKTKQEITYKYEDGSSETEKEETDAFKKDENGDAAFKRFDYGVGALAGVKMGNLFAHVGYQLSLGNISKAEQEKYKHRGLQLTVGYYLWNR